MPSSPFRHFSHATPREWLIAHLFLALDHAAIFILIAASWTPIVLVLPPQKARPFILILWGGTAVGLVGEFVAVVSGEKALFERASYLIYIGQSVLPLLFWGRTIFNALSRNSLACLFGGFAIYVVGIFFYRRAGARMLPWGHPAWHLTIVAASIVNFLGVRLLLNADQKK